jgi:hypothetical protein
MRVKAFVSFVLITGLALIFGVHARQSSRAPYPAWNDNSRQKLPLVRPRPVLG